MIDGGDDSWQWSLHCEAPQRRWLQVRNQRRILRCVRDSTANGCSSSCDDESDYESRVTPKRDKTAKKK